MPDVDIPNRIADQSFLNQTGNVATTTLVASASGNYRLSVYGALAVGSTAVVSITFTWTDTSGAQSIVITLGSPGLYAHDTVFVHATSGSISISASQAGGSTYNLYAAVEQM